MVKGFSALVQVDHVEALGDVRYDDTRDGLIQYPVVADPQGTDLNQAWLQYAGPASTVLRVGRQKIAIGNERFVGPVGCSMSAATIGVVVPEISGNAFGWLSISLRKFCRPTPIGVEPRDCAARTRRPQA